MSKKKEDVKDDGKTAEEVATEELANAEGTTLNPEKLKEDTAPAPKVEIKGKHVKIVNKFGVEIRTYSEEVHGKNFLELAKEFCGKPLNVKQGFKPKK